MGILNKFLIDSENGYLCYWTGCATTSAFETIKAYYVAESYAAAIAEGVRANIWYSFPGWYNSGFVTSDYIASSCLHGL